MVPISHIRKLRPRDLDMEVKMPKTHKTLSGRGRLPNSQPHNFSTMPWVRVHNIGTDTLKADVNVGTVLNQPFGPLISSTK